MTPPSPPTICAAHTYLIHTESMIVYNNVFITDDLPYRLDNTYTMITAVILPRHVLLEYHYNMII